MSRRSLAVPILLAVVTAAWASSVRAGSPLTADKMIVSLRPELRGDRNYITYVAALLDQGQLPRHLVESTFLWAREKPRYKYRYFKQALIVRADRVGIQLPQDNPPVTGIIEGKAVYLVNLGLVTVDLPLAGASVRIMGTDRKATTNSQGEFSFRGVPLGVYTVYARGQVLLVTKSGSVQVTLPTRPPSVDPARAFIVAR